MRNIKRKPCRVQFDEEHQFRLYLRHGGKLGVVMRDPESQIKGYATLTRLEREYRWKTRAIEHFRGVALQTILEFVEVEGGPEVIDRVAKKREADLLKLSKSKSA